MVGIFAKFSGGRALGSHRRTQSALDERGPLPQNTEVPSPTAVAAAAAHGIEINIEFKPVEHPIEPLDYNQPVKCPLPEPSILNDGKVWKERLLVTTLRKNSLSLTNLDSETTGTRTQPSQSNQSILPSLSAPEQTIVNLLEECNAPAV